MSKLHLPYCTFEYTDYGAKTIFRDGAEASTWPHDDHHYHVIAHRCGYGDDILAYCREHDLAHIVAAEEFNNMPSCVLNAQAHGREPHTGLALQEEVAAQVIQRWVRARERPIIANFDWDRLRMRFLGYVARLEDDQHD